MSDFHHFKERLEKKIEKIKTCSDISEGNKKTMLSFANDCYANGLGRARICKLMYCLTTLSRLLGTDFADATKEDLKELMRKIEDSPKNYTDNTKKDFKVITKKLYKWLEGNNEEYPEKVKWIKASKKINCRKLPEDLLTQDDIRKMVQAADNPRDKAMVFVLYESGCRFGEFVSLKLKHIQFDKYGAQLIIPEGKTGARRIRLFVSCDYLRYWLENHPDRENQEAPLWVSIGNANKGEILHYGCIRKRIMSIAKEAGIKKKVNPHNFRHSRATYMANKLKTSQLCVMFGWTQHSTMPSTYIHLSGDDVDDALLKMHGLKKDEDIESISCPRCQKQHPNLAKYCDACGMPFNVKVFADAQEERDKYDELMSKLLENEDVKKAIEKALKEKLDLMNT